MNFFEAVQSGIANALNFKGRSRRSAFWYWFLFVMVLNILVGFVAGFIGLPILSTVFSLVILVPSLAVGFRRMHDIGKPGWYIIIPLISLYWATLPGEQGQNAHGANPATAAA